MKPVEKNELFFSTQLVDFVDKLTLKEWVFITTYIARLLEI